jgi:hypothetical protein
MVTETDGSGGTVRLRSCQGGQSNTAVAQPLRPALSARVSGSMGNAGVHEHNKSALKKEFLIRRMTCDKEAG